MLDTAKAKITSLPALKIALIDTPDHYEHWSWYGDQFLGQKAYARAAWFYRIALSGIPMGTSFWEERFSVLLKAGAFKEIIDVFERLLEHGVSLPSLYNAYALALRGAGFTDEAFEALKEGIERNPLSVGLLRTLSTWSFANKELQPAVDATMKGLLISPNSKTLYQSLGHANRMRNRLTLAHRCYRCEAFIDPDNSEVLTFAWKTKHKWDEIGNQLSGGRSGTATRRFYRGAKTSFFPNKVSEFTNPEKVMREHIFKEYIPEAPVFAQHETVVALGSCFAARIRDWLGRHGKLSRHVLIPEGLNNSFAVRQFLEWSFTGETESQAYWLDRADDVGIKNWSTDKDQQQFKEALQNARGFIVTFGLSEVWRDKRTGGVFWRGVPQDTFDPEIHELHLSTVEENTDNIEKIVELIQHHCPQAHIILTLSPVPLTATMRDASIFVADSESKSILRVAISNVIRKHLKNVYYWPAFEAVRWLGGHLNEATFNGENAPTHPNGDIVQHIINMFVHGFFQPAEEQKNSLETHL